MYINIYAGIPENDDILMFLDVPCNKPISVCIVTPL